MDSIAEISTEQILEKAAKYRNWGRWGPDDELGTLNFVTPDKAVAAARLVRTGRIFQLALPLDSNGPQNGAWGRVNPLHLMLQDGGDIASGAQDHLKALRYTDDAVYLILQCATQWDALSHIFHDGKMYNGWGTEYVTSSGASKNSITKTIEHTVGRGVLLDIPRYRGVEWLKTSEAIHGDELSACADQQGVVVGEGDFVLIRTGALAEARAIGAWGDAFRGGPSAGLAVSAADYLCPRRIAAVATDTWGVEVQPNETPEVFQPLHIVMLVNAGVHFGEMFDLEALASDCDADGVYEFMFAAPPLTVTGAVGSAVTPLAMK